MTEKSILDLILALEGGVWKNWGFIITVNLAVLGWLVQRHGLFSTYEKIISAVAYTSLCGFHGDWNGECLFKARCCY
jgi:hypothetical protein